MASIFTKIIQGELPCYRIFEDELTISFLALDQVSLGHTLVIPKKEVDHWFDTPEPEYIQVHKNAQIIARAIKAAVGAPRVGQIVAGFEVPHYHLHLIPAWSIPDLDFKKAKRLTSQEMTDVQMRIVNHLQKLL